MRNSRPPTVRGPRAARPEGGDGHDTRVLSLLMLLMSADEPLSRADIFARFSDYRTKDPEAGLRKFERDKRLLRDLGVVIEEDPDGEGYRVDPRRYTLPPMALEEDERLALGLAAETWREAEGLSYRELVDEALRKLSLGDPLGRPTGPPAQVAVRLPWQVPGARVRRLLETLERAVAGRKCVTVTYQGGDAGAAVGGRAAAARDRVVEPYRLAYATGHWLLVGHCRLRGAVRTFRVDRILRLRVAGKPESPDFAPPPDFRIEDYVARSPWLFEAGPSHPVTEIEIEIDRERPFMADEDFGKDVIRQALPDGGVRIRFRSGNPDYVVRRVLDAAGHLRVLSPPSLRARVAEAARAIAGVYARTEARK